MEGGEASRAGPLAAILLGMSEQRDASSCPHGRLGRAEARGPGPRQTRQVSRLNARSGAARRILLDEFVAPPADREDMPRQLGLPEALSELGDMDVDSSSRRLGIISPDQVEDLLPADYAIGVGGEELQEPVLLGVERHARLAPQELALSPVERELPEAEGSAIRVLAGRLRGASEARRNTASILATRTPASKGLGR